MKTFQEIFDQALLATMNERNKVFEMSNNLPLELETASSYIISQGGVEIVLAIFQDIETIWSTSANRNLTQALQIILDKQINSIENCLMVASERASQPILLKMKTALLIHELMKIVKKVQLVFQDDCTVEVFLKNLYLNTLDSLKSCEYKPPKLMNELKKIILLACTLLLLIFEIFKEFLQLF